jgi:cold shock CspA family protein
MPARSGTHPAVNGVRWREREGRRACSEGLGRTNGTRGYPAAIAQPRPPPEGPMPQGTIRNFDPVTRAGTLLDDQLDEYAFEPRVIAASGLRELRIGQRVRFTLDPDRRISTLNIVSL